MSPVPSASIVIDNCNYACFLAEAIDSALAQTWPNTEVVVVDDGSEDESRDVIGRYGSRIRAIFKPNGGQGSAFNAGFSCSRGEVVIFLDADDVLLPTAVEHAVPFFENPEVVKVHWPLWVIDEHGQSTGYHHPDDPLPDGDHRERVFGVGPTNSIAPPTSGNAWSRRFLESVLPIPEDLYRISADKPLLELAPFFGVTKALAAPESLYRRHARSSQFTLSLRDRLQRELAFYEHYSDYLCRHFAARGVRVDLQAWKANSWWHRQDRALHHLASLPTSTGVMILVDDGSWGIGDIGRVRVPFLERDGVYAGQPADDASAIRELERLRTRGAEFLVFVWSTTWWLEHFAALREYLTERFPCVLENEDLVVFDLRNSKSGDSEPLLEITQRA